MLDILRGHNLYLCKSRRSKLTIVLLLLINVLILFWTMGSSSKLLWHDQSSPILNDPIFSPIKSRSNVSHDQSPEAIKRAWGSSKTHTHRDVASTSVKQPKRANPGFDRCPDILSGMAVGHWVTRPLTEDEQTTIDHYLQKERGAYRIPPTYQRNDGRCGDVSYEYTPVNNFITFKAICNPKGKTPCCFNNSCVSRSIQECRCPTCYDERPAVHAEYARWEPDKAECRVHNYTTSAACRLLRGANLVFIGDSFIRHVFAATAIVLSGNRVDGALRRFLPPHKRRVCLGMHQITGIPCRALLDEDQLLCHGTVRIRYVQIFPSRQLPQSIPFLKSLRQDGKSLIVLGFGIHDKFDVEKVIRNFLVPFMNVDQHLNKYPNQVNEFVHYIMNYGAPAARTRRSLYDVKDLDIMLKSLDFNTSSIIDLKQTYGYYLSPAGDLRLHAKYNNKSAIFHSSSGHVRNAGASPKLLWMGTHSPGLLKSPTFEKQTYKGVKLYNEKIYSFLQKWGVPYLDTLGFSKDAVSFDGTHFGWGVNMLKVNMILTYVETLLWSGL